MEDTKFPLDIIFINEDLEVVNILKETWVKKPIYGNGDTFYFRTLNADLQKVKIGDDIDLFLKNKNR